MDIFRRIISLNPFLTACTSSHYKTQPRHLYNEQEDHVPDDPVDHVGLETQKIYPDLVVPFGGFEK